MLPRFCTVCQRSSHVKVGVRAGAPTSRIQDHHRLPQVAQACRWPLLLSASACNTARSSKAPSIVQLRAPAAVRRQTDSGACYGARTAGLRGGPTPRAPSMARGKKHLRNRLRLTVSVRHSARAYPRGVSGHDPRPRPAPRRPAPAAGPRLHPISKRSKNCLKIVVSTVLYI